MRKPTGDTGVAVSTGFVPSAHGLPFPNTWRDTFLGLIASRGRCGGMVFAALDHFHAGETPPSGEGGALPLHDSELERYIWRRQVASAAGGLGINLWRFVWFTYLPTHGPLGIAEESRRELAPLIGALRSGRPVPLGLVSSFGGTHLFRNHQVLAVGAEVAADRVRVRVYDPNYPGRDDVVIEVPFDETAQVVERVGSREISWRGLFIERYAPVPLVSDSPAPLLDRVAGTDKYWLAGGALLALMWLFRRHTRRCRKGIRR